MGTLNGTKGKETVMCVAETAENKVMTARVAISKCAT